MRVLLDTNVVVSAVLFGGAPRRSLIAAIRGDIELVTSRFLLEELERLLQDKFGFPLDAAREVARELGLLGDIVDPTDIPHVCRDPDDNHVLAAAVAGRAGATITGDDDLLALESYEGIEILSVAQFNRRGV